MTMGVRSCENGNRAPADSQGALTAQPDRSSQSRASSHPMSDGSAPRRGVDDWDSGPLDLALHHIDR